MLNWLMDRIRRKLKAWLSEEEELSFDLECWINTKRGREHVVLVVTGSVGMHLEGSHASGSQLVSEVQVKDRKQFWRLWKHFNNRPLYWDDGTRFDPPSRS